MGWRRPLINVCDRHDMVADLTQYLYSNNMLRYIEGYVQKVNPAKAPQVVGGLLDAEAPDDFITNLILSVRSLIPVEQLCEEVRLRATSACYRSECPGTVTARKEERHVPLCHVICHYSFSQKRSAFRGFFHQLS